MPNMSKTYLKLANPVTLSFVRKISKTGFDPAITVPTCQVRMMTQAHVTDGVLLRTRRTQASIWRVPLAAAQTAAAAALVDPKPHDVLVINGVRHTVTEVEHCGRMTTATPTWGAAQRFRCMLEREE